MATLEELRLWAQGGEVKGLPSRGKSKPIPASSVTVTVNASDARGRYKINPSGTDALLKFGRHGGKTASQLAQSRDGRGYLRWIIGDPGFESDLKDVCRKLLEERKK
jgi:hypothetical protein